MGQQALTMEAMEEKLWAMGESARKAARKLALAAAEEKVAILEHMAGAVEAATPEILAANARDMETGRKNGLADAMLDRLALDEKRIAAMARGLREVARQHDPVGRELTCFTRPNGLEIHKVTVHIGVIGIIYEARPNVTVDAAGICIKAGNAGDRGLHPPRRHGQGNARRSDPVCPVDDPRGGVHAPENGFLDRSDHSPRRRTADPRGGGTVHDHGHQTL